MTDNQIVSISKFNKLKKSTSTKVKLVVQNVSVYYDDKKAVDSISMNINQNEVTSLIGPSGCGKSTFIRCINRMNDVIENCKVEGNIFFDKTNFYFDDFECVFMGHPYIDFTDILLELGISEDIQYKLFSQFCRYGKISEDREFFKKLYEIQLRKKLGDLISQYIKEIYIYDSYRYDNILNIADIFSHCYERFCKIEIFNKNRDFIMKTICEPIFGVKA